MISSTTRPQRTGEIDGKSYDFLKTDDFKDMLSSDAFIEHVSVGEYLYGVSKKSIKRAFSDSEKAVLVVEPSGAANVEKFCEGTDISLCKIYLNNPLELLIARLRERYETDEKAKESDYKERLWSIAFVEPKAWTEKAYSGEDRYDFIFDSFLESNQELVLETVLKTVESKSKSEACQKIKPGF